MKNTLLLFLLILTFQIGSTQNPKLLSEKDKVRNYVIKETKGVLELPKYFKLEKVTIDLIEPHKKIVQDVGVEEVFFTDSTKKAKYMVASENFMYGSMDWNKFYKIDSISYHNENITYSIYFKNNGANDVFEYKPTYDGVSFYKQKKVVTFTRESKYYTKIIFWAMSKGGELRLYTDIGVCTVDSKGVINYEVLED